MGNVLLQLNASQYFILIPFPKNLRVNYIWINIDKPKHNLAIQALYRELEKRMIGREHLLKAQAVDLFFHHFTHMRFFIRCPMI